MKREEVNELSHELDHLLEEIQERTEPRVARMVAELVDGIQRVHAEGLRRLAELLAERPALFERALEEPVISNLFLLYELAVVDPLERAREALESVRPMARSHGGDFRVTSVEEGIVRVRLAWSHDSVSRQAETLRDGMEWALNERLPGYRGLEVEEVDEVRDVDEIDEPTGAGEVASGPRRGSGRSLPVLGSDVDGGGSGAGSLAGDMTGGAYASSVAPEKIAELERRLEESGGRNGDGERETGQVRRVAVGSLEEIADRTLFGRIVDGREPVLVVRLGDDLRAFRNACPDSILPLDLGELREGAIYCPWHGCRYDAMSGERLDEDAPGLDPLPLEVEGGTVWVAIT